MPAGRPSFQAEFREVASRGRAIEKYSDLGAKAKKGRLQLIEGVADYLSGQDRNAVLADMNGGVLPKRPLKSPKKA